MRRHFGIAISCVFLLMPATAFADIALGKACSELGTLQCALQLADAAAVNSCMQRTTPSCNTRARLF